MGNGVIRVYLIFWLPPGYHFASHDAGDAHYENLLEHFFVDISGSPWLQTLQQYSFSDGTPVENGPITGQLVLAGAVRDTTPLPHAGTETDPLRDSDIQSRITVDVQQYNWHTTVDTIIYVATPDNIQSCDSGRSCTFGQGDQSYCAYHSAIYLPGSDSGVPYATLPDIGCAAAAAATVNGYALDGTTNAVAHELAEAITDPVPSDPGWTGNEGEIGDICVYHTSAEVTVQDRSYVVPQLWSNQVGRCVAGP